MTNLLIAYPDVQFEALEVYAGTGFGSDWYPAINVISEDRSTYAYCSSATSHSITFDAGYGNTKTANYVIVARANALVHDRIRVQGISGYWGDATTDLYDSSAWQSNLKGVRSEDFIATFSPATYRTFKVLFSSASAKAGYVSKIYLGQMWDAGRDPDYSINLPVQDNLTYADSGTSIVTNTATAAHTFTFTWRGLTDAAIYEFEDHIADGAEAYGHKFFLYTSANHAILNNFYLVHAKLISHDVIMGSGGISDWNDLSATFEEVLS
jgi:hypothetical protein